MATRTGTWGSWLSTDRARWCLGIFFLALGLRLVHLVQILPAPFFPFKMGDAASYDNWAAQIAGGDWLGNEVFYQAPLYPYFLAIVYRLIGDDMFSIRLSQAMLGAASCGLLASAGWSIFSKRVGILSGLLLAVYAPALFFDSLVQKSVLDALFLCLMLTIIGVLLDRPRARWWCALGVALGGLVLARENALVLVPAVLVWLASYRDATARDRWKWAASFALGVALLLVPVALRNFAIGGELHLTTSQFGPNFYIGNNPDASGTYKPLRPRRGNAKYERHDAAELAQEAVGRQLTPAEVSHYWTRQALQFIRRDTGAWLRLMGRKFLFACNAVELVDTEDQYTYAEWSMLLRTSGYSLHMGTLMPLAVWGVWVTWPRRRRLLVLYLMVLFYLVGLVIFYVVGRYRYPLVPILILLAAAGILETRNFWRQSNRRRKAVAVVCCLLVALLCNLPIISRDHMRAITHYNVAVELDAMNLYEAAADEYKKALQLDPTMDAVHNNLGCDYLYLGRLDAAIRHFEYAVAQDPQFAEGIYNLGTAHLADGNLTAAANCFQELIELRPDMPKAYLGRAIIEQHEGNPQQARAAVLQALSLQPNYPEAEALLDQLPDPPR